MDIKKKNALLQKLDPEIRGTKLEAAFLSTYEEGYVPMWERAAKPPAQVAKERAELLVHEKRKRGRPENGAPPSYQHIAK